MVTCKLIRSAKQLQAMRNDLAGSYCLANDIDAGTIANFAPIGDSTTPFTGRLLGKGHVIRNLTIKRALPNVGLFGAMEGAVIEDLSLVDAQVIGKATSQTGGLVGAAFDGATIARVFVTGLVKSISDNSKSNILPGVGGIAGIALDSSTVTDSGSAAKIVAAGTIENGFYAVGGLVGQVENSTIGSPAISRSHASGSVTCDVCEAGGLTGRIRRGTVVQSFATGNVTCGSDNGIFAGGLIGESVFTTVVQSYATGAVTGNNSVVGGLAGDNQGGIVRQSYATGPVTGQVAAGLVAVNDAAQIDTVIEQSYAAGPVIGGTGETGGLIAHQENGGTISESYAVGPVSGGGVVGGLIGSVSGSPSPSITASFWDVETTGQTTSAGGLGTPLLTAQLRAALPSGFSSAWAITSTLSYPFLDLEELALASPLATLVHDNTPFVFLPIGQFDAAQYLSPPLHPEGAALATVYTMIARAVGIADNVADLDGVKIDKFFWDDTTQTTTFAGPLTQFVALGPLAKIGAHAKLNANNVIGAMDAQKLVILRGRFTTGDGTTANHWMLATLYTKNPDGSLGTVVAHDPWSGAQVEIDPITKQVLSPPDFPLADFTVNRYQPVTLIEATASAALAR